MADIKACDRCGHLFTPRGPWQMLHAVTFGRVDGTGHQPRTDVALEVCSDCMYDPTNITAPVLELATQTQPEDGPEPEPEDRPEGIAGEWPPRHLSGPIPGNE